MANHPQIRPIPQDAPPPIWAPTDGAMNGPVPDMGPAPTPMVSRIPTTGEQNIAHDQAKLQKVQWNQENPWGTPDNHPGKLGKVAHVFSTLGNIAGDIFAPSVMANIPGTEANMKATESQLAKRVNTEQTNESQNQYRGAEQAKTEEETREAPGKAASSEALQGAETAEKQNAIDAGPTLIQGHAHAVNQAIKNGRDPATDPLVQQYEDAITRLQKQPAEGKLQYETAVGPDGKPHVFGLDAKGNKVADVGQHYEKPININTGNAEVDRIAARLGKPYEKGISDASAQLDKIADARAMINGPAEAQALGIPKVLTALVSGAGSGVRITQPELNAIAKARGLGGDIEGTLNSWSGKGKLTTTQKQQLTQILDDVHQRILAKQAIHSQALDAINGAGSHEEVVKADREARQKLNEVSQGHNQPQRPANVPEGYQFNQNGPKGGGWYAPTAK